MGSLLREFGGMLGQQPLRPRLPAHLPFSPAAPGHRAMHSSLVVAAVQNEGSGSMQPFLEGQQRGLVSSSASSAAAGKSTAAARAAAAAAAAAAARPAAQAASPSPYNVLPKASVKASAASKPAAKGTKGKIGRQTTPSGISPDSFHGQAVEFVGTVKDIKAEMARGNSTWRVVNVSVDDETWQRLGPCVTSVFRPPPGVPVYMFKLPSNQITVSGTALGALHEGQRCSFKGVWDAHNKFGVQINASTVEEHAPSGEEDWALKLAGMLDGVGNAKAKELVRQVGADRIEQVLDSQDAVSKISKLKGFGTSTAERIKRSWDRLRGQRKGLAFLNTLGLRPRLGEVLLAHYRDDVEKKLREDPWGAIMNVPGGTYAQAQVAAQALGLHAHTPTRAALALQQQLLSTAVGRGHTFLNWVTLKHAAEAMMLPPSAGIDTPADAPPAIASPSSTPSSQGAAAAPPSRGSLLPLVAQGADLLIAAGKLCVDLPQPASPSPPPSNPYLSSPPAPLPPSRPPAPAPAFGSLAQQLSPPPADAWPDTTRCYNALLHRAETEVAAKIASLAARCAAVLPHYMQPPSPSTASPSTAAQQQQQQEEGAQSPTRRAGALDPAHVLANAPKELMSWLKQYQEASLLNKGQPKLTEEQEAAVLAGADAPLLVLTGAAGCGKTYATAALVELWRWQGKDKVLLCAPTGRAAQRLQELANAGGGGLSASTIHRMLGYKSKGRRALPTEAGAEGAAAAAAASSTRGSGAAAAAAAAGEQEGSVVVASATQQDDDSADDVLDDPEAFEFNEANPLDADVVLVDEASMLDVQLAAALMRALKPTTQLVVVGDDAQLPPVGPGQVLQDLLTTAARGSRPCSAAQRTASTATADAANAGSANTSSSASSADASDGWLVPVVALARVLRQAGGAENAIVSAAHDIKEGREPAALTRMELPELIGLLQRQQGSSPDVALRAAVNDLICGYSGEAVRVDVPSPADVSTSVHAIVHAMCVAGFATHDVQIIAPTKRGVGSVEELNHRLQPVMNAASNPHDTFLGSAAAMGSGYGGSGGGGFGSADGGDGQHGGGRRTSVRAHDRVVQIINNYDIDVYNGDLGRVVKEEKGRVRVQYLPRPGSSRPHLVDYLGSERHQVQLAWATTVHKAQGGEFPVVIVALQDGSALGLLNRLLLYTAATRARQMLVVVSSGKALGRALRSRLTPRHSSLLDRLALALPLQPQAPAGDAAGASATAAAYASRGSQAGAPVVAAAAAYSSATAAKIPIPIAKVLEAAGKVASSSSGRPSSSAAPASAEGRPPPAVSPARAHQSVASDKPAVLQDAPLLPKRRRHTATTPTTSTQGGTDNPATPASTTPSSSGGGSDVSANKADAAPAAPPSTSSQQASSSSSAAVASQGKRSMSTSAAGDANGGGPHGGEGHGWVQAPAAAQAPGLQQLQPGEGEGQGPEGGVFAPPAPAAAPAAEPQAGGTALPAQEAQPPVVSKKTRSRRWHPSVSQDSA